MSHPSSSRTPSTRARVGLLLLTLLAPLLGAFALGTGPASAAQHAITIKQYMFMPASMSIRQGDTITWTNQDTVGHDVEVTSGPTSFHSPMLAKGQSWSFTFGAAGTYSYICSVHPDMRATVTVAAAPVQEATQPGAQPQHQSHVGPSTSSRTTPTATRHATAPRVKPSRRAATTTATTTATTAAPAVVTPGSDAALDPLLLVAGVAVAVVVFCLLLLTSRPERPLLAPAHRGGETGDSPVDDTRIDEDLRVPAP